MPDQPTDQRGRLFKGGQTAVGREDVKIPAGRLPAPTRGARAAGGGQPPEIGTVLAADGTIEQITVRCSCGEEIVIQCDYLA